MTGLKLKMSQITDVALKGNQEPTSDQVINIESEFILCLFVE